MNAFEFATKFDALATFVLAGARANVSLHITECDERFAVLVFDSEKQEMHQMPIMADKDAAYAAAWKLRDALYTGV